MADLISVFFSQYFPFAILAIFCLVTALAHMFVTDDEANPPLDKTKHEKKTEEIKSCNDEINGAALEKGDREVDLSAVKVY